MMRLFCSIFVALFAVTLSSLRIAAAESGRPPAPYQIDGLVSHKDDHHRVGDGLGLNAPLVAVDLGQARDAAHPGSEQFRTMTIVGTAGVARGVLYDIRKICDYLCGDDGQECHYQALYSLDGPDSAIGTPIAAFPGAHEEVTLTPIAPELGPAPPSVSTDRGFAALAWSPQGAEGPELSISAWQPAAKELTLKMRWGDAEPFIVEALACSWQHAGPLAELHCNGLAMIFADGSPLLLSYPDYNLAAADVVASLKMNGIASYLVRLGLKAQTVFGIIHRDDTGWRGLFRPRDYALLC
jgi:hypothetical protein